MILKQPLDNFEDSVKQTDINTEAIKIMRVDVDSLIKHRDECDALHTQHVEHRKRHDDSMNNLTASNIALAKAITDVNITLTTFTKKVEEGQPVISFWTRVGTFWGVQKDIWKTIISIALGVLAIAGVYKLFV